MREGAVPVIRRFEEGDAAEVSRMIIETINTVNAGDYSAAYREELTGHMGPEDLKRRAKKGRFYVAEEGGRIVGCGGIAPEEDGSVLFNVFVGAGTQGRGIGRRIVETLEADPVGTRSRRIRVPASITALGFYRRLGYVFSEGGSRLDDDGLYGLEKRRGEMS